LERRRPPRGGERRRPRGLRARRHRQRDAAPLAARRARGPGGGRAFLRPRDDASDEALRPVRGRSQPGVRRHGRRDAGHAVGRVTAFELGNVRLSGRDVMQRLHLRSTWFSIGELSLTGTRTSMVYGHSVGLVAGAHAMGVASLQQLTASGWVTLRRVSTGARVAVSPRAYTIYRLTAGRVRGPEVGVEVSPLIRTQ